MSLVFRTTGGGTNDTGAWQRSSMTAGQTSNLPTGEAKTEWSDTIPGGFVDSTGVDYYLELLTPTATVTSPANVLGLLGVDPGAGPTHHHVTAVAPPLLRHTPTLFTPANKPLAVTAQATCSSATCQARLFYKTTPNSSVSDDGLVLNVDAEWLSSGVDGWSSAAMTATASSTLPAFGADVTYNGQIPGSAITTAGLDYFILITDGSTTSAWPGTTYQAATTADGVRTGFVHVHVLETPHIVHVPTLTSPYRTAIPISATATCAESVECSGRLYFRTTTSNLTNTTAADFESTDLTLASRQAAGAGSQDTATFTGTIPARVVDTRGVDYFFSITDGTTTSWYPGTSQVDGHLLSMDGVRVGYSHVRVLDPPHIVPTTSPVTNAGVATEVSILASCATESCDAALYYARKPVKSVLNAPQAEFVKVPMVSTGAGTTTSIGTIRTYKATIPAADVTTRGLLWVAEVRDGYVTSYSPGIPYVGAYLAAGGTRVNVPDTGLLGALRGVLDPSLLNTGAGLADIEADGWSAAPVLSNLALGDKVDELLGATAGEINVSHAIRVLEPPHVLHVPTLVAPRAVPLEITAKSNCSAVGANPRCRGFLTYQQADGTWDTEEMTATRPAIAGGLWEFGSEVPADAMSVTIAHYRIRITDGVVSDTTPTLAVTTQGALAAGVVSGRAWIDRTPDPTFETDDVPVAKGTVVRAVLAGLDLKYATADDVVVTTAKADAAGRYYLKNLVPGVTYGIRLAANPAGSVPASTTTVTATASTAQVTGVNLLQRALDSDNDGLHDILETFAGLNPNGGADSDNDGLSDFIEVAVYTSVLDPTKPDSDNDGLRDDADDIDGDALTNLQEAGRATNPLVADEDQDNLDDLAETVHHTKFNDADTDADTLPDGFEVNAGTDPTKADTDGDGTPDGAETLTSTVTGTNATVELTGTGPLAEGLSIVKAQTADVPTTPGMVGPVREITLAGDQVGGFDHARITLPYPDTVTDPSDLGVFYFDEEHQLWVPAATTFARDTVNHTVSVEVDHFSLYAVIRIPTWANNLTAQTSANPELEQLAALDTAIVIDTSYSMEGSRLDLAKAAATDFVNHILPGMDHTGLIEFWNSVATRAELGTTKTELLNAISTLTPGPGTNIYAGVDAGLDMLTAAGRGEDEVVLLLTDGEGSFDAAALAARAQATGVRICTVSVGTSPTSALTQLANDTGCEALSLDSEDDIANITGAGTDNRDRTSDDDQDGLPNFVESGDASLMMPGATAYETFNGAIETSPTDADTDDDSLLDGEEVQFLAVGMSDLPPTALELYTESLGLPQPEHQTLYVLRAESDPQKVDTDFDGLTDPQEFDRTNPRSPDEDHDGRADPFELEDATNPENGDTDGDSYDDGYEFAHASHGYDPRVPKLEVSKTEYVKQFTCGALPGKGLGEWLFGCDSGTVAFLAGDICSSLLVYGDIRNAIDNLLHREWTDALIDLVALVPLVGDAAGVSIKISKFVRKGTDEVTDTEARAAIDLVRSDPDEFYDAARKSYGDQVDELETKHGFSEQNISDIQKSNISIKRLVDDMKRPFVSTGERVPWLQAADGKKNWQIGEDWIRSRYGDGTVPGGYPSAHGTRKPDATVKSGDNVVAHESKVGAQSLTKRIKNELDKDCDLNDQGKFSEVVWHFLPGITPGGRHRFGGTGPLLDYIKKLKDEGCNISVVFHLPN